MISLYHNCLFIALNSFHKPVRSITTKLLNLYELFNGSLAASAEKDLIEIDYKKSIGGMQEYTDGTIVSKRIL